MGADKAGREHEARSKNETRHRRQSAPIAQRVTQSKSAGVGAMLQRQTRRRRHANRNHRPTPPNVPCSRRWATASPATAAE